MPPRTTRRAAASAAAVAEEVKEVKEAKGVKRVKEVKEVEEAKEDQVEEPPTKRRRVTKEVEAPAASETSTPTSTSSSSTSSSSTSSTSTSSGKWSWPAPTLMFFETGHVAHSAKLATFDYDGCLAKTSLFKKGPDAWEILFPSITGHLQTLHDNGYKLVIFTNQSDIGKAAKPESRAKAIAEKQGRLEGFVNKVGLPFQIFVAACKAKEPDQFRKPETGMWDFLIKNHNGGIKPDMEKSFFVGDAAGRKKDHSDVDKGFAKAVGVKFFTEDEFFVNNFPTDLVTK